MSNLIISELIYRLMIIYCCIFCFSLYIIDLNFFLITFSRQFFLIIF
jgi:hypothetical protein